MEKAIDRVLREATKKGMPLSSIEKELSFSNGYLGSMYKKRGNLGEEAIIKLSDHLGLSLDYILKGKGPIVSANSFNGVSQKATEAEQEYRIPFYDTTTVAGTFSNADLSPVMQPAEMIDAGDWFRDATSAMRVHGDSMYPDYPSGSIVVMKEVENKRLVVYGQDYVFETSEFRVLKRLQRGQDEKSWLAYSINEELWQTGPLAGKPIHEPFEIYKEDLTRLFIVLGSVTRTQSTNIIYNNR